VGLWGHAAAVFVFDAATGDGDVDFAGDGRSAVNFPAGTDYPEAIGFSPDGGVVIGGYSQNGSHSLQTVARFTPDGAVDPAFGTGGVVAWDAGPGAVSGQVMALDVDGQGRILAGGYSAFPTAYRGTLTRLTPTGGLDATFGTNGLFEFDGLPSAEAAGVAVVGGHVILGLWGGSKLAAVAVQTGTGAVTDTTPPTITITTPADGAVYATGSTVSAAYFCSDAVAVVTCGGDVLGGNPIDPSTPGIKTFTVDASDGTNAVWKTVTYTVETQASATVPPGGTLSAGTATLQDPYKVDVTTSTALGGPVSIAIAPDSAPVPTGYSVLGSAIQITAPAGTTAQPLRVTFRIDASVLAAAGISWDLVQITRDGVPLASCAVSAVPCVASQSEDPTDHDAIITVLTDHASVWQAAARQHLTTSGFYAPVDNPPVLNTTKAGSAVPVKLSVGGYQGMNLFAAGSPSSQAVSCSTSAPMDAVEQTVTAGSSTLTYDAASQRYTYAWKTDKAWAGSCRQLTVKLADGTVRTALFKLTK
jgi:uncharacterized delta-60 repeat protein